MLRNTKGVVDTQVGYSGGDFENPTYRDVCTGKTGHAEVVLVEYDPAQVTFEELLHVFFENHDPTALNRQGPDIGSQYRSAIFYYSEEQGILAKGYKDILEASGRYKKPVVTEINEAGKFYRAEEYHQQYYQKMKTRY